MQLLRTRLGVDKVKPKGWVWGCGDFRFWGLGLHAEDGGPPQVLPLTAQTDKQCLKVGGWVVVVTYRILVSAPVPFGLIWVFDWV